MTIPNLSAVRARDILLASAPQSAAEEVTTVPDVKIALLGRFDVIVNGSISQASRLTRRQAAALVKLLALTPAHQLHRERVLDLIWPDDTVEEALPKLHKAAHYARRACEHEDAVVLRGELVRLFPDSSLEVDALTFESLAHRALELGDVAVARAALALYGGELLPEDRFEDWADLTRENLAGLHRELLRLDARWRELIDLDAADEGAHVELMRQHLAAGDRHAAIRQFERLDRALRQELGVAPGPEARRLRERAIAEEVAEPRLAPVGAEPALVGRERELAAIEQLLDEAATGTERSVFVSGPAGMGKSTILAAWRTAAERRGLLVASGTAAPIEGSWPYAPIVEAISGLARRHPSLLSELPEPIREELDGVIAGAQADWSGRTGHQRFFVAAAALFRAAAQRGGLLITIDDVHDADDASLRLLHYLSRALLEDRIVLAMGVRPAPHGDTLAELRHSMVARHGVLDLELAPLTQDEVATIVARQVPDAAPELVEQVTELSGGVPFAAGELARRAAEEPEWVAHVEVNAIGGIPPATREILQRVAVLGLTFDTDDFLASSGLEEFDAFAHLDSALSSGAIERTEAGYQFRHRLVRDALLADVPPHRRRLIHRDVATRLIEANASPAQIGHHLIAAGETVKAVPHLLGAAESEAGIGAYRDALGLLEQVRATATGENRARLLYLRADLLTALGDQTAVGAYREALDAATGDDSLLHARLARAALMAGDLHTAAAALDGVDASASPDGAEVLLVQGQLAYFTGDYETARRIAEQARLQVLGGDKNWQALDLMSLQGLLAHQRGEWFDRMRLELRNVSLAPDVANAIFDGYLCPAEYLLYGSTPYDDVIQLARAMQATAEKSGALRAVAFARALVGESALLSGDLDLASAELVEAAELHHVLGSGAGEAHCLQRLAEVRLAQGDSDAARRLLDQALPLARWSMIAMHLIQRIYGTMIAAAPDAASARAIVDRAESTIGTDDSCQFCGIMLALPAMVACARTGDLARANHYAEVARRSSELWEGTSWRAAFDEAQAHVTIAEGGDAIPYLDGAIHGFERAGQPIDAARAMAFREELTSA